MDFETVQEAIADYNGRRANEQNLSEKHCKNRRLFTYSLATFFVDKKFDLSSCREFIEYKTLTNKPASMRTVVKLLRAFVRFCFDYEYLNKDFSGKLILPTVPKVIHKFPTEQQAIAAIRKGTEPNKTDNKLAQKSKIHVRQALLFALFTMLRHSEIRKLTVGDLDIPQKRFVVNSKGGAVELAVLTDNLIVPMTEWIQGKNPNDRLFEVSEEAMRTALKRGFKKLGLPEQRVHDLRDVGALARLNRDSNLQKVSRILRHKKIATTDEYYSQYLLKDLEATANNTTETQKGSDIETVLDVWEQLLKNHGALDDGRFYLKRENGEIVVRTKERGES